MLTLPKALDGLLKREVHRFTTLYKIERRDSTVLYFTDHDIKLEYDGNTYVPTGGVQGSATRQQALLEQGGKSYVGVIVSGLITFEDLRGGKYREAKVTEYLVDWRYPWVGAFVTYVYWITETVQNGEYWEATVEGASYWMRQSVGEVFSRDCRHELGDALCKYNLAVVKQSGSVFTVSDIRQKFVSTIVGAGVEFFSFGQLDWTSGNNNGETTVVRQYNTVSGEMLLQLPIPYDIQIGDTFDVWGGCDKTKDTCTSKFNNFNNFGGFPYMPGTKKMLVTPSVL